MGNGVEVGWYILAVNNKEISDFKGDFAAAKQYILDQDGKVYHPGESEMKLQFTKTENPNQERMTLFASQAKLGISFHNNLPLVINRVEPGSWADKNGVQTGWVIVSCNNKEMS